jgi:catechol 2,3-dioxygenase-like lactoylglutathione lyase family enzyme
VKAGFHHVALRAADVDATAEFYRRVLGLPVVRDARPRSVWLAAGDGAVLMVEARSAGEPAIPAGSMELFALAVTAERKAEIRALAIGGGFFDGETEHTVYVRDPDRRRVGVSTFALPDTPEATR